MITIPRVCLLAFAFSVIAVIGCGGGGSKEDLVDVVPVSGKVTLNGEPLKRASVTFMPEGVGKGSPCYGVTGDDGTYTLKTLDGRDGCPTGPSKVVISKYAKADGSPLGDDPGDAAAEGVEHLPPQYSSGDHTQLTADVPEGGDTFDFDLEDKKK